MVSSNWVYKAWDGKGKSKNPVFKCSNGTEIELYKNWVHIKAEGKTISVFNGELETNSFFLYAERFKSPYNAIFIVIFDINTNERFFGIGAYAWDDNQVGISDPLKEKFIEWVNSLPKKTVNPIIIEDEIPTSFEGL